MKESRNGYLNIYNKKWGVGRVEISKRLQDQLNMELVKPNLTSGSWVTMLRMSLIRISSSVQLSLELPQKVVLLAFQN